MGAPAKVPGFVRHEVFDDVCPKVDGFLFSG